ncbi:PREDICTED: uncharacterized protein LOC105560006 [Vollenhovia emeryi]|uniref:uncharacterized protein LOC105560006 n=1 Tax=Vollenhovia emeryi TaxID=411798 RepID=UPI0005F5090E|nr:PREDICTED: uncharacterized protein LOC105560006 [Vollenhovia emeryi]
MTCNFELSALHGTWFAQFRLGFEKVCRFIGYFITLKHSEQMFLEHELNMSSTSVVDWSNFCRELLSMWLDQEENMIGGPDCIVEIDEAKIGKRKYNRGRIVKGQWVFGALERGTKRIFVVRVSDRSESTLINIIRRRIAPGTTIYSDCWRAYTNLKNEGFKHFTVNHSENFVDPITGVHTQNIERLWRDMRSGIPRYGIKEEHYNHYIAEFMFKRIYNYSERIDQFFTIMSQLYPLTNNVLNENE